MTFVQADFEFRIFRSRSGGFVITSQKQEKLFSKHENK